jgi:hypothetical protein
MNAMSRMRLCAAPLLAAAAAFAGCVPPPPVPAAVTPAAVLPAATAPPPSPESEPTRVVVVGGGGPEPTDIGRRVASSILTVGDILGSPTGRAEAVGYFLRDRLRFDSAVPAWRAYPHMQRVCPNRRGKRHGLSSAAKNRQRAARQPRKRAGRR